MPRIIPGAKLTVVADWPSRSEDERGEPTRNPASELLRKNLSAANVEEFSYVYAISCRPPKGTSKKDIQLARECCLPGLQADVGAKPSGESDGPSQRKWVLSCGDEAFRSTTGKLGSNEPWIGSPVDGQWPGIRVIPTWSPGFVLKADGSRFAPTFATHVWRAAYLSDGRLGDFEWPEDVVDEGPKLYDCLVQIAAHAESGGEVSVDLETRGLGHGADISCVGFASDAGACCVQLPASSAEVDSLVRRILRSGIMVGQNISAFDRQVLAHHRYEITPAYHDTLLAAAVLDPQLPKNLTALVSSEFHAEAHKASFKSDKETGVLQGMWDSTDPKIERDRRIYCLRDAYTTLLVWQRQKQRLKEYV